MAKFAEVVQIWRKKIAISDQGIKKRTHPKTYPLFIK
jgi:hypothetical protein